MAFPALVSSPAQPRAIRTTSVAAWEWKNRHLLFPDSALAHWYCVGQGIEIGAAAHNPFHLPGCLNLALPDDFDSYQQVQAELCGSFAEVDYWCDAAQVERCIERASLDYIVSSHVLQFHPNPLQVLLAWTQVLKPGGVIFLIVPKRDADPLDRGRPLTPLRTFRAAYDQHAPAAPHQQASGSHAYIYSLGTLLALVGALNQRLVPLDGCGLQVEAALENDDKVGNGHCLVLRQAVFAAKSVHVQSKRERRAGNGFPLQTERHFNT